jgi:hypothetical protein
VFILFGLRTTEHQLGVSHRACPNCRQHAAQVVSRRVSRFTLFFIPLFPVKTSYGMRCTYCAASYQLTGDQARDLTR